MFIIIYESPSTTNGVFPICSAHDMPLISPSSLAILFVLLPIDPQSMLRIISSDFLIAPPNPAGPRFPLVAPSKLYLKDPSGGLVQVFTLLTEVGAVSVSALLIGNSTIPNSYKIFLSFTFAVNSSCIHWFRVIVSFRWASMMVHISPVFLVCFQRFDCYGFSIVPTL